MKRQLRVIVLDISPTSRKILEVILRREGHQVVCFDDPLEALRFLSRHRPPEDGWLQRTQVPERRSAFPLDGFHRPPQRARWGPEPRESPPGRSAAGDAEAAGAAT